MKRVLKDKICSVCKKVFRPRHSLIRHCSFVCSRQDLPKKGKTKECSFCRKASYTFASRIGRFCSVKCRNESQKKRKVLKCQNCKKEVERPESYFKYNSALHCSQKCYVEYRKKHPKSKSLGASKKRLWIVFSQYIRRRDRCVCISCGVKKSLVEMDAGHYVPRTAGLSLYFDERNVNAQCQSCNRFRHGNLSQYALGLRKKYGESILEELEADRLKLKKYSKQEYLDLIEEYTQKLFHHCAQT